jgi:membrane-bound lytic murein transglycosylase F
VQNIRRYYDVLARMMKPTEDIAAKDSSFVGLEQGSKGEQTEEGADMRAGLSPELGMIPPTL